MRSRFVGPWLLLALFVVNTPALAQQPPPGDLYYSRGAQASLEAPGYTVGIGLRMWNDTLLLDAVEPSNPDSVEAEVHFFVHAKPTDQVLRFDASFWVHFPTPEGFESTTTDILEGGDLDGNVADFSGPGWVLIHYEETTHTVPHAGPNGVSFLFDGFIPHDWMGNPLDVGRLLSVEHYVSTFELFYPQALITEGDNRSFSYWPVFNDSRPWVTARAALRLGLYNSAYNDVVLSKLADVYTPFSELFDARTSLSNWPVDCVACAWLGLAGSGASLNLNAINDFTFPDSVEKIDRAKADSSSIICPTIQRLGEAIQPETSSIRITCSGSPYFPLHTFGSSVKVNFQFTLTFTFGNRSLQWTMQGCHDAFPAFEAYLGNSGANVMMTAEDSGNAWDMFFNCSTTFSTAGVVFFNEGGGWYTPPPPPLPVPASLESTLDLRGPDARRSRVQLE
jgi:hypothetical protein